MDARTKEWDYGRCLLGLPVRIPPGAWVSVCCECRALSVGGLCDGLISFSWGVLSSVVCLSVIQKPRQWGGPGLLKVSSHSNRRTRPSKQTECHKYAFVIDTQLFRASLNLKDNKIYSSCSQHNNILLYSTLIHCCVDWNQKLFCCHVI